ncbi:TetR/AcrR family transcriptional regulator [Vallitalea pronyensis]|uniref:TetR/AcrR family transcriptional regulator n=1 Tax=Vallitalea pronyensis TaxID=1348613 RepID=A0A8J8MMM3_9FIRM|nr:TetR/AcrR family transcriptional regulator [Vallitalea pronyensis]QUI24294.1 TetR/AcrR family transcriptional regulator [Vallitalea pronyensis]
MPKDTFFNLSDDKKNRILSIVIDEFACNDYKNVSISRIVKDASIAKGSFYQYFEDKKDLYQYLIHKISEKKLEYLSRYMAQSDGIDFFEFLKSLLIASIVFSKDNPKFSKIAERLIKGDDAIKKDVLGQSELDGVTLYESLLKQGVQEGKLNKNIDIRITAIMIASMGSAVIEYVMNHNEDGDYKTYVPYIDQVIEVLKRGIQV